MRKSGKILLTIIFILLGGCWYYVSDYYQADTTAIEAVVYRQEINEISIDTNTLVFSSDHPQAGLIFYPGGKVEYTSYIPLMKALAQQNILCILIEMPFNLAVFDINAADNLIQQFPEIQDWYLCGHSLGGSMAASYIQKHTSDYKGLILLASYSTEDLTSTSLDVLSIYGSEDQVLNSEKYETYKSNLPSDFTEIIIEGGCHAYFGMYGAQKGDGLPTITNEQQIEQTAQEISIFIQGEN